MAHPATKLYSISPLGKAEIPLLPLTKLHGNLPKTRLHRPFSNWFACHHFSFLHPDAVLNLWSRPVDAQRIAAYRAKMQTDKSVISFVADDDSSQILGYGELVLPETLGAIYVAAPAGRRGVASALLRTLEAEARDMGTKVRAKKAPARRWPGDGLRLYGEDVVKPAR
jgi:GNAT superfamily N-acetyltransferase